MAVASLVAAALGAGVLVHRFVVYAALERDDVEAFWLDLELIADEPFES